jgi:hypothetical protein
MKAMYFEIKYDNQNINLYADTCKHALVPKNTPDCQEIKTS